MPPEAILYTLLKIVVVLFVLLTAVAYAVWFERKVVARMQSRWGPTRVGPYGLLQPLADAIKLLTKEDITPSGVFRMIYIAAPALSVITALLAFAVIPFGPSVQAGGVELFQIADLDIGLLFVLAVSSMGVYGIVLAGWSSNSKYAMLGGLRSTAQMISYELALVISLVPVILLSSSMNMIDIVEEQGALWYAVIQPVGALIFWIATLAEVNRAPFDMPEAEQELTAGYHSEYSGMKFALFFMAEYQKMIVICAVMAVFFFGGYLGPFVDQYPLLGPFYMFIKIVLLLFAMIWVRATWPRIRYDRLMEFGWKALVPLSLAIVFITATGILLVDEFNNPALIWVIPAASLLVGLIPVVAIYRSLRRLSYGRA